MSEVYYISRNGLINLIQKRKELIQNIEEFTRLMGQSANLDNDLRENPEFMQLRTRVTYEIPSRIANLDHILRSVKIIDDLDYIQDQDFYEVMPGMEVELTSWDGEIRIYSILGYEEGDPERGIVSYKSVIGEKLIYKTLGDKVDLPSYREVKSYVISNIKRSPYLK